MSDQLAGIRRILEEIVAPELRPGYPTQMLRGVVKNLAMLESSWSSVLPFLQWDTEATAALLREAAPYVDEGLRARIAQAEQSEHEVLSVEVLDERNTELRGLLAEAIGQLMLREDASDLQARVKEHLVTRMSRYPFRMAVAAPTKKR